MSKTPPPIHRNSGSTDQDYVAFISYRHADNQKEGRQWASWLHHTLETYEVPEDIAGTENLRGEPIPERLFPVFRDEEELPADADLSTPIVHALEKSRYLVVLCSPGAVASRFVADEVARFKAMGKENRVIAAILSGEPNASSDPAKQASGHSCDSECFPEPLRFEVEKDGTVSGREAEPLAADFRLPDGSEGWTSPEPYRKFLIESGFSKAEVARKSAEYSARLDMMKLKVIAGILGVPLGVLTKRDKAYQLEKAKRRAKTLRLWLALTTLLAFASLTAGFIAWNKQQEAEARKLEVIQTLATSDFQQGTRALQSDSTTPRGMALLARAVREGQDARAATRLWTLLQQRSFWIPSEVEKQIAGPTTRKNRNEEDDLFRGVPDSIRDAFSYVERDGERIQVKDIAVSPGNRRIVTIVGDVVTGTDAALRIWNEDGSPVTDWFAPVYEGNFYLYGLKVKFSPDGRFLAVIAIPWREPQYVEVYNLQTMQRIGNPVTATGKVPVSQFAAFTKVNFIAPAEVGDDGYEQFLLTGSGRGDTTIRAIIPKYGEMWELATNQHSASISETVVDSSLQWLMSSSADGEIRISDIGTGEAIGNPIQLEHPANRIERVNGRNLSVSIETGETHTLELRDPHRISLPGGTNVFPESKSVSIKWSEMEEDIVEGTEVAAHPAARWKLLHLNDRQFSLKTGNGGDNQTLTSAPFPADLALVTSDESGKFLTTSRSDFITEIWNSSLIKRVAPPLIERNLFAAGATPETTSHVTFLPEKNLALTESNLFQPPNLLQYWYCLWDTRSGLLLMDRTEVEDDSFDNDAAVRIRFDQSNQYLLFLARVEENQSSSVYQAKYGIEINPPEEVLEFLPDLAEAIAGITINREGIIQPVPNRISKVQDLYSNLKASQ